MLEDVGVRRRTATIFANRCQSIESLSAKRTSSLEAMSE
jgi:hypothetical protein